jgi:hypothetical protein
LAFDKEVVKKATGESDAFEEDAQVRAAESRLDGRVPPLLAPRLPAVTILGDRAKNQ